MVMATGIVSADMRQVGQAHLAGALLAVGLAGFGVLAAASAWRVCAWPGVVRGELTDPASTFTFFTLVAAANVLAVGLQQDGHRAATLAFAAFGLLAWLGLCYLVPAALALRVSARPAITAVNGTWYLWVVGTQSVAIVAASDHGGWPLPTGLAALAAVTVWSAGVILYLVVTVLVLARLLLAGIPRDEPIAPYWISMGAASITVFGAARILQVGGSGVAGAVRATVTGLAVLLWAFATWLIPLLLVLAARLRLREVLRQRYHTTLWTIVFPLGMYAIAGLELAAAARLRVLHEVGAAAAWPALGAWSLTFIAMLFAPFGRKGLRGGPPTIQCSYVKGPPSAEPTAELFWPAYRGTM
jgi:tellurite resistance protein TehA-like permease